MSVDLGPFAIGGGQPLVLIAGPCQAESPEAMAAIADALDQIATRLDLPLIFKASFDKANRTSADAARGMGLDATLRAFDDIRRKTGRPVLTDVHLPEHCARVAEVVDVLQIPADIPAGDYVVGWRWDCEGEKLLCFLCPPHTATTL